MIRKIAEDDPDESKDDKKGTDIIVLKLPKYDM